MKIAVTVTTPDLDADIDPRFGRCLHFIVVDLDTMECEALDNSAAMAGGGAGIAAAQNLTGKNIEAVLTGNCGPNAYTTLTAAGVKVITGLSGKARDAIKQYKAGTLQTSSRPNVAGHFGTGGGMERGRGTGRRFN
jgi:predicted Fe-Mo cluster-binding NifX family protein